MKPSSFASPLSPAHDTTHSTTISALLSGGASARRRAEIPLQHGAPAIIERCAGLLRADPLVHYALKRRDTERVLAVNFYNPPRLFEQHPTLRPDDDVFGYLAYATYIVWAAWEGQSTVSNIVLLDRISPDDGADTTGFSDLAHGMMGISLLSPMDAPWRNWTYLGRVLLSVVHQAMRCFLPAHMHSVSDVGSDNKFAMRICGDAREHMVRLESLNVMRSVYGEQFSWMLDGLREADSCWSSVACEQRGQKGGYSGPWERYRMAHQSLEQ